MRLQLLRLGHNFPPVLTDYIIWRCPDIAGCHFGVTDPHGPAPCDEPDEDPTEDAGEDPEADPQHQQQQRVGLQGIAPGAMHVAELGVGEHSNAARGLGGWIDLIDEQGDIVRQYVGHGQGQGDAYCHGTSDSSNMVMVPLMEPTYGTSDDAPSNSSNLVMVPMEPTAGVPQAVSSDPELMGSESDWCVPSAPSIQEESDVSSICTYLDPELVGPASEWNIIGGGD